MVFHKILVTGADGMLGTELVPYLDAKGYKVFSGTSKNLNLLQTIDEIQQKIEILEPDIIIHAAAYTDVDGAEANPDLAMAVNKDGSQKVALVAQRLGIILAMISTDYVFDGRKGSPYTPTDRPNPINTYGLSKYYGELIVRELVETAYIIRTSWLYGIHKRNFVQFVLSAAQQGREINIIDDQFGSPTWTGSLCSLIEKIILSGTYGIYHASDQGAISRYEQALAICKGAGLSTDHIRPASSQSFNQAATRPRNSALDCAPLLVPHWETALQGYLKQYFESLSKTGGAAPSW